MPVPNSKKNLIDDVRPREVWGWMMFDFANSGYTTVVITAVFNAYFVAVVAGQAVWATFAWTAALSISYALIVVSAPLIGAYADTHAAKKRLLVVTTIGCVAGTAALALVGPGELVLGITLLIISNFFFGTGENLVAAFLPELARGRLAWQGVGLGLGAGIHRRTVQPRRIARLRHLGASTGAVLFRVRPGDHADHRRTVRRFVPADLPAAQRAGPTAATAHAALYASAFARTWETLRHASRYRDLMRFLLCILFYQAGVQAVISLAAIYSEQEMKFSTQQTIMLILVVNVTASVGAIAFGQLQDKLGHVRTLALTLIGWCLTVVLAGSATTPILFWMAANLAGVCLGASQSAGRALVGYLSPSDRRAEFFGLWGLAVKLSSILGPMTYGLVSWISAGNHRLAILITGVYFLIGLALLAGVNAHRGHRAARSDKNAPQVQ